jgi:hypothetical protein
VAAEHEAFVKLHEDWMIAGGKPGSMTGAWLFQPALAAADATGPSATITLMGHSWH